jgi:hypothetical protein
VTQEPLKPWKDDGLDIFDDNPPEWCRVIDTGNDKIVLSIASGFCRDEDPKGEKAKAATQDTLQTILNAVNRPSPVGQEVQEALEPFARAMDELEAGGNPAKEITVHHLRKAREALAALKQELK